MSMIWLLRFQSFITSNANTLNSNKRRNLQGKTLLLDKYVMAVLPTGFGKIIIYESFDL